MVSAFTETLLYAVAALGVWLYWRRSRQWAHRLKGLKQPGVAFPLIGHLYHFFGNKRGHLECLIEGAKRYRILEDRKPSAMWFGEVPTVGIFRPEDYEVVLGSMRTINKPNFVYEPIRTFFGDGLITLNGDPWQHHRKVLTPVFHFKILERYAEVFKKHAEVLVEELCSAEVRGVEGDAMPFFARLVSQTICETAFGMSGRLLERDEVKRKEEFFDALNVSFKTVKERLLKPWLMVDVLYRLSSVYTRQKKAEGVITDYASRIIRMKKEEIARDEENPQLEDDTGVKKKVAFLDLVLRDAKDLLREDEILHEVRTLVAVQQTTASTLSFIFVMLAIHQDVQEEVFREIQELDDHSNARSYYERLGEMKYLERVIKETMRLYPVTALFSRKVEEDLIVPSGKIPGGSVCFVHVFMMQRDERIYGPGAEKFNPDHFLPERCRCRHPYAYIPFSAGPRNCVGQKYAMLQMKAVVSTVVRNVRVFPGQGCRSQEEMHLDVDTFLHIVGGFNVRFEPREILGV